MLWNVDTVLIFIFNINGLPTSYTTIIESTRQRELSHFVATTSVLVCSQVDPIIVVSLIPLAVCLLKFSNKSSHLLGILNLAGAFPQYTLSVILQRWATAMGGPTSESSH